MLSKLRCFLVCITVIYAAACHAATLNVGPGQQYTTIQSAINAANDGDTVLVAPGTYFENIDFLGKAITVTSSGGVASTIIDGSLSGTVVFLGTATSTPSVLTGFTVQNGYPKGTGSAYNYGGGIDVIGNATVRNNTVTNIHSCGIDVIRGPALISANHVLHNVGTPTAGADCQMQESPMF